MLYWSLRRILYGIDNTDSILYTQNKNKHRITQNRKLIIGVTRVGTYEICVPAHVNCTFWPIETLNWLFRYDSVWSVDCINIGVNVWLLSGPAVDYTYNFACD